MVEISAQGILSDAHLASDHVRVRRDLIVPKWAMNYFYWYAGYATNRDTVMRLVLLDGGQEMVEDLYQDGVKEALRTTNPLNRGVYGQY